MRTKKNIKKNTKKNTKKSIRFTRKKRYIKKGGKLVGNIFKHIQSIGFEIETNDLIKFSIINNEMINSSLANTDLEEGLTVPDEVVDIINTDDTKIKITNDQGDDSSKMNIAISEFKDDTDDNAKLKLYIPENTAVQSGTYPIKMITNNGDIITNDTFTDTEWIATYYKPQPSDNIILSYFLQTLNVIKQHLNALMPIENCLLEMFKKSKNRYEIVSDDKICFSLPNTNLIYLLDSTDFNNADIFNIEFVAQMTFSCDIIYIYKIMYELLQFNSPTIPILPSHTNIEILIEKLKEQANFDSKDVIDVLQITKRVTDVFFLKYSIVDDNTVKKLKMYLFVIFYKLFIYINVYIEMNEAAIAEGKLALFKYSAPFMVRHYNINIYLRIKQLLQNIFNEENVDKYIDELIDDSLLETVFYKNAIAIEKRKNIQDAEDVGNPLYSINSYFKMFEFENEDEDEEKYKLESDYLYLNNIDEKSTKFPLEDDRIIVEYRSTAEYLTYELYLTAKTDEQKTAINNLTIGVLNMNVILPFLKNDAN
jgi:hypothetical protein